MSHPGDQVDLIYVTLTRQHVVELIDGKIVRVDIAAGDGIPPTVVILRSAAKTGETA